jgi:hypothetical protein
MNVCAEFVLLMEWTQFQIFASQQSMTEVLELQIVEYSVICLGNLTLKFTVQKYRCWKEKIRLNHDLFRFTVSTGNCSWTQLMNFSGITGRFISYFLPEAVSHKNPWLSSKSDFRCIPILRHALHSTGKLFFRVGQRNFLWYRYRFQFCPGSFGTMALGCSCILH